MTSDAPPGSPDDDAGAMQGGLSLLLKGGSLRVLSTGSSLVLALPATVILVRALGLGRYGGLQLALAVVTLVAAMAGVGLGVGLSRMCAFDHDGAADWGRAGFSVAVISGTIGSAACLVVAAFLPASAAVSLRLIAPTVLTTVLTTSTGGYFAARSRYALVELLFLGQQVAYYGAASIMGLADVATVANISLVYMVVNVLATAPQVIAFIRDTGLRRPHGAEGRTRRQILAFSFPLMLQNMSWQVLQRADVLLLGVLAGTSAVGLYQPVLRLVDMTATAVTAIGAYYVPVASGLYARGLYRDLQSLYILLTKWSVAVIGPVLALLIVAPHPLLTGLFGPAFSGVDSLARIMAVGYALHLLTGPNGGTLVVLGKSRAIAVRSVVALVVNVALDVVLIPRYGALGAATATGVAYVAMNCANSYLVWRSSGVHPIRLDYVYVIVALAVASLAAWFLPVMGVRAFPLQPLLAGGLIAVAALAVAWLFRAASEGSAPASRRPRWLGAR